MESSDVSSEQNQESENASNESSSPKRSRKTSQSRGRKGRGAKSQGQGRGSGGRGVRGRGVRGRGARGRQAKSRGRGRHHPNQGEEAVSSLEQSRQSLQAKVDGLDESQMKTLLKRLVEKSSSMAFDLLEEDQGGGGGYHPSGGNALSWCTCQRCREMPTQPERVCCKRQPHNCITSLPYFDVLVLDDAVLALARLYREDVFALPGDEDLNRANRHTAYRQFVLWQFGCLGPGVRKVVPSCAVWKIRHKFPDAFGQYTGFIPSRLA